jgi:hypothetical protein
MLMHNNGDGYAFGYVNGEMIVLYNKVHYDIYDNLLIEKYYEEHQIDRYMVDNDEYASENFDDIDALFDRIDKGETTADDITYFYGTDFDEYKEELKDNGEYDEDFMEWRSDNRLGRFWESSKIISFWDYPKNNNELHQIIIEIEKASSINIWNDNEWKIEIYEIRDKSIKKSDIESFDITEYDIKGKTIETDEHGIIDMKSKLIPLKEFTSSITIPEEELKIHLMTPIEKEKYYKAHPEKRPKKTSTNSEKSIAWRQAINRSESIMKKVNNFKLFEASNIMISFK